MYIQLFPVHNFEGLLYLSMGLSVCRAQRRNTGANYELYEIEGMNKSMDFYVHRTRIEREPVQTINNICITSTRINPHPVEASILSLNTVIFYLTIAWHFIIFG